MKIKKIFFLPLFCILMLSFTLQSFGNAGAASWYIKRNGGRRPVLDPSQEIILEHGGYYLDPKVSDDSSDRVIYLTFDAGYENGNIEKILDVMKEEGVNGAFFVLSHLIVKNTDLVKRMAEDGNLVCNHTCSHKDMTKFSREQMTDELRRLEDLYREKTGYELAKYYRPPEGKYSEENLICASDAGYKTVFWSFAYADWDNEKQPDPDAAKAKILENTHNGEIILLHPTSATNAAILGDLIREWKKLGYRFGTLDEL